MDNIDFNNDDFNYKRDFKDSSSGNPGTEYTASFYTENYKKPKSRRNSSLLQLVLVAVLSSILGGGIVFAAFQFVAPAIQPAVNSYFGKMMSSNTGTNSSVQGANDGVYKKIEITQSDSPVTAIAEKVSPSIVGIRVTARVQDFFFGESDVPGEGSGIILRSDGYILTNNHVISGAMSERGNKISSGAKIEVILPNQKDKTYTATVVGRDSKTDLAVLKIDATGLPAAELGNSDELKVGELAVAIGNPGGLEYMGSVTVGVLSGLNRTIKTEDGKDFTLVQTDAAINPGNSGGALVNSKGQVIGVNTIKIAAQGFEGLGFAIPINRAKEISEQLINHNYVTGRPKLGIYIDNRFNEEVAKQYNVPNGLLVMDVELMSGAYKAGIKTNDIITKFDGKPVKSFAELEELKNKHKPGDKVKAEIYRDGETLTLEIQLGEDKPETGD